MPTWLTVVIGLASLGYVIFIVAQIPYRHTFFEAAAGKDLKRLNRHLNQGESPNRVDPDGMTPLIVAVYNKRHENVRVLLARGANPNLMCKGCLPFIWALQNKDYEMMELLLAAGTDIDLYGEEGVPPIMSAVEMGDFELFRYLHRKGAKIDIHIFGEGGPIEFAVIDASNEKDASRMPDRIRIVEYLLEHGANPNARYSSGAALVCMAWNTRPVLQLLVDHGAIIDVEYDGIQFEPIIRQELGMDDEY